MITHTIKLLLKFQKMLIWLAQISNHVVFNWIKYAIFCVMCWKSVNYEKENMCVVCVCVCVCKHEKKNQDQKQSLKWFS